VIGEQRREAIDVKAASDAPARSLDDGERSGWRGARCDVIREGPASRGCECVKAGGEGVCGTHTDSLYSVAVERMPAMGGRRPPGLSI
jgi:hypothetical protein